MNDRGKSDGPVVPATPPNKAAAPAAAEAVEERGPTEGNAAGETRSGHRAGRGESSDLDRVRKAARKDKQAKFTALMHHLTIDRLRDSYRALRPKAAPGADGVSWEDYGQQLEANLQDLHGRLHRGAYRAMPSRRVQIPKPDGAMRSLGIAALEDKIVQRATVEVLNQIYEEDFLGFSYGFRPGRSAHQALDALAVAIVRKKVNWVLDADLRGFFDTIDHDWLLKFCEHRIADKRILRLIRKWLGAGIIEEGSWTESSQGAPQGGSASPLLANVYLHYVLDLWASQWRGRQARGVMVIVRYADDFVVGFEHKDDAARFQADLRERLAKFALELNAEKTRLIEFGRRAATNRKARGLGRPETFEFLGFTHFCAKTRKGRFKLQRVSSKQKMRAKLRKLNYELRRRMHRPIPEQGRWLRSVLIGHFNYYAVPDNARALSTFRNEVIRLWWRALRRRSQRTRMTWERMARIVARWLPTVRILHPWPSERFAAMTQGRSPVR